jgi:Fe-S-cluster-containing hydrogenase component 2
VIRVIETGHDRLYVPVLCAVCPDAPCVRVCPADALSREGDFGKVTVDEKRCASCSGCVLSCPFEVLRLEGSRSMPNPCDLCGGDPECVRFCRAGALELVHLDEEALAGKRESSSRLTPLRESLNP